MMDTNPHKLIQRYGLYNFKPFQWEEEKSETFQQGKIPKPRCDHRMALYKDFLVAFGGFNPNLEDHYEELQYPDYWPAGKLLFKEMWAFNIHSRRWTKLDIPRSIVKSLNLSSYSLVVYDDKLVLYGPTGDHEHPFFSRNVLAMNISIKSQHYVKNMVSPNHKPVHVYGRAVFLYDGYLYRIGCGITHFMDVHRLNLTTKHWECVSSMGAEWKPAIRFAHEVCLYNNYAYVLGGSKGYDSAHSLVCLPCFDLKRNVWTLIETQPDTSLPVEDRLEEGYPGPRCSHSIVQSDNYVFLIGGFDGSKDASGIFRSIWRLDLDAMRWKRLPLDLPHPLIEHASAMTDTGKVFVYGGCRGILSRTMENTMYSCWIKIPSLKDMCWEAINHYVHDLDTRKTQTLLTDGIPRDLTERLLSH